MTLNLKQTECYGQNKPNVMAKTNINLANVSDIFKSDQGKKISIQPAIWQRVDTFIS